MDAPGQGRRRAGAAHGDPLTAVFTERRADLRRHAGEISFPGGRQDDPDEDLRATALREARRRSGLPAGASSSRRAPPVGTFVTGYRVCPFVGPDRAGPAWRPQETEVARCSSSRCPSWLAGHEMKRLVQEGVPIRTPTYTVDGHLVWGRPRGSCSRCWSG